MHLTLFVLLLLAGQPSRESPDSLASLYAAKAAIDQSTTGHARAAAWLRFQKAADEIYQTLPANLSNEICIDPQATSGGASPACPGFALFQAARRLGADLGYCESDRAYVRTNAGWVHYLDLWPDGPDADEAFWQTRVEPPCCDECAPQSPEEADQRYGEFLRRFPHSRRAEEAKRQLKLFTGGS